MPSSDFRTFKLKSFLRISQHRLRSAVQHCYASGLHYRRLDADWHTSVVLVIEFSSILRLVT
ncbi:hypothetical protein AGABI2DRAFT_195002 [Agaricus bisporus var. bisporus H97]|uniref:hypothetical protein n=1 Tax=Agaricus bisporus var. bisporus (strain H97 / ATCC MYA-4626 / FGSC 10389) TaxID=936046 RepID=UPI00029F4FB7|nr:hypothetical protein AGABI2DRAFT_195002 [Agaricus bisporus var. bisporus H97]EKV44242.1 hypothetical protein AGABI2DRAFT_195002 [Agaricus bisporus var. bisporus H97]